MNTLIDMALMFVIICPAILVAIVFIAMIVALVDYIIQKKKGGEPDA